MATGNIATQISRLQTAADKIKAKTASLGLTTDGTTVITTDKTLDVQATAIDKIIAQDAETITPSTEDQTIEKGKYLKGNQTIKAVGLTADASKIVTGNSVSITSNGGTVTSVSGTLVVNKYIVGSDTPSTSTSAEDGDIYLVI